MGKYYAQESGEEKEVSLAIAQHYRPIDTNDIGDISRLAAIIAIADKMDSIIGLWLAGEKPTSSKDPFALRRNALGIIKLIRYHEFELSLAELTDNAAQNYALTFSNEQKQEIIVFFNDRLKYYLKAENFRHDLISAVLSSGSNDIYHAIKRLQDLQEFVEKPDSEALLFVLKRISRILADTKADLSLTIDKTLFKPIELELYEKMQLTQPTFVSLSGLIQVTNKFFDEIIVNDEDKKLRQNRLCLLYNILNISNEIANFSLVEV